MHALTRSSFPSKRSFPAARFPTAPASEANTDGAAAAFSIRNRRHRGDQAVAVALAIAVAIALGASLLEQTSVAAATPGCNAAPA
jgi:uncharacterized protein HemX